MFSPLSGSGRCLLIKKLCISDLKIRWKSELGIDWKPNPNISELKYWLDESTGLYFYTPADVAGDASLYEQLQRFRWYYMEDKWEFIAALNFLKPLPPDARVLEIGSGDGAFLKKARDSGYDVAGIELNPIAANAAKALGFTVYNCDISNLHCHDSHLWDSICAFQLLEHIPFPRLFLDQVIKLLKPGGFLLLSVPNAAVVRRLDPLRVDLLDQPPHHMSHWDKSVFKSLESLFPLRLVAATYEPLAPYHVDWFASSWLAELQPRFCRIPCWFFFRRAIKLLIVVILRLGFRHLVRGHTLLVCLQRTK